MEENKKCLVEAEGRDLVIHFTQTVLMKIQRKTVYLTSRDFQQVFIVKLYQQITEQF